MNRGLRTAFFMPFYSKKLYLPLKKKAVIRNAKMTKDALARMVKLIATSMHSLIDVLGAGGALAVLMLKLSKNR